MHKLTKRSPGKGTTSQAKRRRVNSPSPPLTIRIPGIPHAPVAPHFWIREASENYHISPEEILPTLTRILLYLIFHALFLIVLFLACYPIKPQTIKTSSMNEAIKLLFSKISDEWPSLSDDLLIWEGSYHLGTLLSFKTLLKHNLDRLINAEKNQNARLINAEKNQNEIQPSTVLLQKLITLRERLEAEVSEFTLYFPQLPILDRCFKMHSISVSSAAKKCIMLLKGSKVP
jgi:hypothetical protein